MHALDARVFVELISIIIYTSWICTVNGICAILDSPNNCIEWNQCRESDNRETLSRLTLQQCWAQCRLRPQCKAIDYWRRNQSCDVIYTLTGDLTSPSRGPCVRILSTAPVLTPCSECGIQTSCEPDVGNCIMTVCPPLSVADATVYGNVYSVGAKAKIVYPTSPPVSISPVCQPNALWAPVLYRTIGGNPASTQMIMFYNQVRQQGEANSTCAEAGQSLLKMDSMEKFNDVLQFLDSIPGHDLVQYWIQGKHVNGVWRYDDGDVFHYENVPFHDMNGGWSEPCVRMIRAGSSHVGDRNCDAQFGFMCESTNI